MAERYMIIFIIMWSTTSNALPINGKLKMYLKFIHNKIDMSVYTYRHISWAMCRIIAVMFITMKKKMKPVGESWIEFGDLM